MRRAGQKRPVPARAIAATLPADGVNAVAVAEAATGDTRSSLGKAIAGVCSNEPDDREAHHRAREIVIQQRIESRLPGRVRNLLVRSFDSLIILEGQCATFYTKQLAQHAAMGVLEDEQLENAIEVGVGCQVSSVRILKPDT